MTLEPKTAGFRNIKNLINRLNANRETEKKPLYLSMKSTFLPGIDRLFGMKKKWGF
jgi:hypothetical protein